MPEKLKLPSGYKIEIASDSIVLRFLNKIVDTYTPYASEKNIIFDAIKHSKQREKNENPIP